MQWINWSFNESQQQKLLASANIRQSENRKIWLLENWLLIVGINTTHSQLSFEEVNLIRPSSGTSAHFAFPRWKFDSTQHKLSGGREAAESLIHTTSGEHRRDESRRTIKGNAAVIGTSSEPFRIY